MTKKTFLTVAAVSVLSGGLVVATTAFAQTSSNQSSVPSLVQEISSKFHLNQNDVQAVFAQHRQEVQAKMESNYEAYLQNLVNTGKLTEEQEQLILNKHKQLISEMQSNVANFKSMTPAQRQAQMQSMRKDLQTWAQQNNINLHYLRPFGFGRGFGRGFIGNPPITPSPTP